MSECVFCKIVKKEIPADIVFENDHILAFLDINPVNAGHTLIVPKQHCTDLLDTPDDIIKDMMVHTKKVAKAAVAAVKANGFNIGINTKPAAGQVVFHTHLHIIPRFSNDGLKHWPHKKLEKAEMLKVKDEIKKALK